MNPLRRMSFAFCLSVVVAVPAAVFAEGFEGTLKWRKISVPVHELPGLAGSEAQPDPSAVFAIPMGTLLAKKGAGVEVEEETIYVKGSKVRADIGGLEEEDKGGYVIMDVPTGTSTMVMPQRKKFVEWSAPDVDAMTQRMEAAREQMMKQLAGLPPEQRKQVESMMQGMGGGGAGAKGEPTKLDVRPLGKTQTINGMEAAGYEVHGGRRSGVGWVTQAHKELGRTLQKIEEDQKKLLPPEARAEQEVGAVLASYGLPVRVQHLGEGEYEVEELVEITPQSLSADLFAVPGGFEKTTMDQMMRHGEPRTQK